MYHSAAPVLKSKIRTPSLPQVCVARPRLEDRALALPESASQKLLYLSAPPGYGKTTVLCRIASRFPGRTVWLSLDSLDNDPQRLADHLLAALRLDQIRQRESSAGAIAGSAQEGSEHLINALYAIESLAETLLLVFDDAHTLQNEAVFEALRSFIAYQPENCRIAIASREDLPLPMSAHRQSDRLVELRAADLRADDAEATELLSRLEVQLDPVALSGVLRKTAGWWSCLRLFAISWHQRRPEERVRFLDRFRGTSQFIAEFLLESLVWALPAELADAAFATAVPEFFNEGLYTILTGREDCARFVERMQHLNIIAPRPGEGSARFRYHPLLRDYLRHQVPRARRAELHRTTARWFAVHGYPDRSARHAQLAQNLTEPTVGGGISLSHRERELLEALAQGLSNDEIAARLFISTGTVKWHLNNIYGKLGARSRTDAVHKARAAGVVSG
ncbi:MAG: LuxR family transcriptional regulator [Spirochaetaceae bacterium]|nr:MAG: LuxR family transcriptional regulator [Spirochaetaceae bacterium]